MNYDGAITSYLPTYSPLRRRSTDKGSPVRSGSPGKRAVAIGDYTLGPEVNRAVARELYVNSIVNVVNPSSRKSARKVKPGQMNLFNPKGQHIDAAFNFEEREDKDGTEILNMPRGRTGRRSFANI